MIDEGDYYSKYLDECGESSEQDLDVSTPSHWGSAAKSPLRGKVKRLQLSAIAPSRDFFQVSRVNTDVLTFAHCRSGECFGSRSEPILNADLLHDLLCAVAQFPNKSFSVQSYGWTYSQGATRKTGPVEALVEEGLLLASSVLEVNNSLEVINQFVRANVEIITTDYEHCPPSSLAAFNRAACSSVGSTAKILTSVVNAVRAEVLNGLVNCSHTLSTALQPLLVGIRCIFRSVGPIIDQIRRMLKTIGALETSNGFDGKQFSALWIDVLTQNIGEAESHVDNKPIQFLSLLLLAAAWPWLETLAWVCTGCIPQIDEEMWLTHAPQLFRMPFQFDATRHSSCIALAASCEGVTRHVGDGISHLRNHTTVAILRDIEDSCSKSNCSGVVPIELSIGRSIFRIQCSFEALDLGMVAYDNTISRGRDLCFDRYIPVLESVPHLILHPLGRLVKKTHMQFVQALMTHPSKSGCTFRCSVNAMACAALFEDPDILSHRFIRKIVALPISTVSLGPAIVSMYSEALSQTDFRDTVHLRLDGNIDDNDFIRVMQSVKLEWNFPEQHAVILLPHLYYSEHRSDDDSLSKVFRLLMALHVCKALLVEARFSRRVVGAVMHCSFVVDELLQFLSWEVEMALKTLRTAVQKERICVANICRAVDDFLCHIETISLQHDKAPTSPSGLLFHGVGTVVRVSLELCRSSDEHPSHDHVIGRVRMAVERMIATIKSIPTTSSLHQRVQPLLMKLTYNRFFDFS